MLKLLLWRCTLRSFAYTLCVFGDAGVDPVVIESRADEMVGSVSRDEYKALVGHLSGARRNRVFHILGLSAPQRAAELKLAEGQGGPENVKALEKAKRKRASSSAEPNKRGRLIDAILQQSPLQSKRDSKDDGSEDSNREAVEAPPFAVPKEAPHLRAVPPNLDLEFSTTPESDDEEGDEEVNIIIDSPRRSSAPPQVSAPRSCLSRTLRLALGRKGVLAKSQAARRTASASSSAMLTPKLLPRSSERSPRPCVLAARSSSPFVLRVGTVSVNYWQRRVARFASL